MENQIFKWVDTTQKQVLVTTLLEGPWTDQITLVQTGLTIHLISDQILVQEVFRQVRDRHQIHLQVQVEEKDNSLLNEQIKVITFTFYFTIFNLYSEFNWYFKHNSR